MTFMCVQTAGPVSVLTEVQDKVLCIGDGEFPISKYFNKRGGTERGGVAKVWVSSGFERVFGGKTERRVASCAVHVRQLLDTTPFSELCEQLNAAPHGLAINLCHVYRYMRYVYQQRRVPRPFSCFVHDTSTGNVWPLDVSWDRYRWCMTIDEMFWTGRQWQVIMDGITRSEEETGWYRDRVFLYHE